MIFPSHCKFIGVINRHIRPGYRPDDAIYFSSQYVLVFDAPDRCEVFEVESTGEGFIRRKNDARRISSAAETLVYPGLVDISNRADLLRRAVPLCTGGINTVVFQGIDRHYMFVKDPAAEALTTIEVHDVAPPDPAWLAYNVKKLVEAGMFGELMLAFEYHVLNLKDYEDSRRTTIFPCHASGLNGLFLDSLDEEPQGDVRLVGCNTSKLVFEARYPLKRYEHVNICPLSTRKPSKPFILRCCQSDKLGMTELNGVPGVVVHWGANPREIYEAVRTLAATIRKPEKGE
ncbi:DUF7714 family protein [Methanocella arvoryzae]|uniref:Uncharacterized protein n=1 Tax=Methanocella arvoryzae (strain DSM 22066 / NBRC 105507 / MRE50) TaxID=351160 RepID=Q0W1Q7_METAR|nr:hypothetical protein [Methanocella arvoryzae]CAJ37686.1 conserved hypothetical protein [Methanocella arvoryzae MRE50]